MTTEHGHTLTIYLLAGVATTISAFLECRNMLENLFTKDNDKPKIHVLFPYGDYTRNLWRQVWEVRSDLSDLLLPQRIGGRAAAEAIRTSHKGGPVLMIGHSGGGVAAYQAARMLRKQGIFADSQFRIAQVGSPKIPIDPELKEQVGYFHAVDVTGRLSDPISRIGSWGGWSRNGERSSFPGWNKRKYAPGFVTGVPVIGGHANYFRHLAPYVDEYSVCNLEKTVEAMINWLKGWSYYDKLKLK